jgi:molybdopterin synthase sulfur carrier subunit
VSSEITVRYWAAARDAAGCAQETLPADSLADVITRAGERHGADLQQLLGICSYLIDGTPAKRSDAAAFALTPGAVVEVLPPFAGG